MCGDVGGDFFNCCIEFTNGLKRKGISFFGVIESEIGCMLLKVESDIGVCEGGESP